MALLTDKQKEREIKRERERQEALAKKREIQQKKELFGENYKQVERAAIQNDVAKEIGSDNTPKLYDFSDVYDFFNPIIMYKSKEGKVLKMDFTQFQLSEEKFKQELEEADALLEKLNKEDKLGATKADKAVLARKIARESELIEDGITDFDETDAIGSSELAVIQEDEADEQMVKEEDGVSDENEVDDRLFKEQGAATVKRATAIAKAKLNQVASIYLERFIPRYNKQICSCCGMPKNVTDYYIVYDIACNSNVDDKGSRHMQVCKECSQKIFNYYYSAVCKKEIELAMQYTCCNLNLYWDNDVFQIVRKEYNDEGRKGTLLGAYIKYINSHAPGLTFMDSPFLEEKYEQTNYIVQNETPYDWDKEDVQNKKLVLDMVGYDPFEHENEEDRKKLYRDLLAILTDGMEQDFIKLQAGINIVQSFFKIRKLTEKQSQLERENAPLSEQKAIAELKSKELTAVSTYAKDNGMSERYQNAKDKGQMTLTGMMRTMDDKMYEDDMVNKYNVETSATIQQAADASFKAIMGQLSLSDAEVWKLTQDQFKELTELRRQNAKLTEDLRKEKYKVAELNLREKERIAKENLQEGDTDE